MRSCESLGFLALIWAGLGLPAAAEPPADVLRPGAPVERTLAAGEFHVYRAELAAGHWWIAVDQRGIDVTLAVTAPEGGQVDPADSPLDRRGIESLVVRAEAEGEYLVEVRSREPAAPPGRYEIRLQALGGATPEERLRLAAETARMEAAQLYSADRRSDALARYREALDLWGELGRPGDEARALYCAAVLHRLVGETQLAFDAGRRVLTRWQELGDRYWEAATLNEIGLNQWTLGESGEARATFERALALRRAIGDRLGEIKTRNNICLTFLTRGELRQGLECYQPVFEALDEAREPQFAAAVHTNGGWVWDRLGEPDQAIEHYERALALNRRAGDRRGEAQTLNNLAWLRHGSGQLEDALASYERALEIFRELEERRWQGIVLHNIGTAYGVLGEPGRALSFLRQALALRRQAAHRRGEVATLNYLALIHRRLGELQKALDYHRQALAVVRDLDDPRQQAITLQMSAATRAAAGEPLLALEQAEKALELLRQVEDRSNEAAALDLIGRVQASLGEPGPATASLGRALMLRRAIRDRPGEAETLTALARVQRARRRLEEARASVEAALELIEGLRAKVGSTDLRATFQSTHRQTYELQVDLLMALHRSRPDRGHDREALASSERARARSLLDLLNEGGREIRQGVDPALLERRSALERRLAAKAARQTALLGGAGESEEAAAVERELDEILHQLERVEAEIESASPRYADLIRPRTLAAAEIQALLDPETALLEYALGEERSFLWWVTSDDVAVYELPGRSQIEAAARRLHQLLSATERQDRRQQAATAAELHRMLLAPVAGRLGDRRLVVVADGALHYLPFAALPDGDRGEPLVVRHEIVHLPSATVLALLRRELASRTPAPKWLAVVADPVFELDDPRLAAAAAVPETALAGSASGAPSFRRLPGSGREAESIAALAPPGETLMALGFEASRTTVLSDRLRPYRVVHFATHGVIDAETPRLSGLVLSLFDRRGRPQEGFLRLHDLYDLDLGAELVVLSGCRTALGREIRGEGLVGLTRGFMYAGAPRVVASLWRVEDRATAELLTRFHRSMAADGLSPAAALRAAQLSLRQERRWKDPYYWAGFVLMGEWAAPPSPGKG